MLRYWAWGWVIRRRDRQRLNPLRGEKHLSSQIAEQTPAGATHLRAHSFSRLSVEARLCKSQARWWEFRDSAVSNWGLAQGSGPENASALRHKPSQHVPSISTSIHSSISLPLRRHNSVDDILSPSPPPFVRLLTRRRIFWIVILLRVRAISGRSGRLAGHPRQPLSDWRASSTLSDPPS